MAAGRVKVQTRSGGVVEVDKDSVDTFLAAGFTRVEVEKSDKAPAKKAASATPPEGDKPSGDSKN